MDMEWTKEFSAGGIVLRHSRQGGLDVLLIQHRGHRSWGFPKGWIEPGETPQQAALREVEEESGVRAQILVDLSATHYIYVNRQKERVAKTVTWYLMRYVEDGNQTHPHEVSAVEWLPIEAVHTRLTYKNDKDLFSGALSKIVAAEV